MYILNPPRFYRHFKRQDVTRYIKFKTKWDADKEGTTTAFPRLLSQTSLKVKFATNWAVSKEAQKRKVHVARKTQPESHSSKGIYFSDVLI